MSIFLYEILVPCLKDGKPVRTRYHRVWDEKVRKIANGLTIMKPQIGNWLDKEGNLFIERVIPVKIACSKEQINIISDFTAKYYNQKAIMFYKISDEVTIKEYK